jgi:hypothetical protein
MNFYFAAVGIIFVSGCKQTEKIEVKTFKLPVVINSGYQDTSQARLFLEQEVSQVFPRFVGKFKFADTIDINREKRDTAMYKDFLHEGSGRRASATIDVNGFELFVDYSKTLKYKRHYEFEPTYNAYYPVYFVNSTSSDKLFLGKDSYAFGIQEAVDTTGWDTWKPIEGKGFDFCGNGHWGLIVHPQEFVVILMQKYKGDFETGLRVRFAIGESRYVSKPYPGFINQKQFELKPDSYLYERLQETNGGAASYLFYGYSPDFDDWVVKAF